MRRPRMTLLRLLLALVLVAATTLGPPTARVFAQAGGRSATALPPTKAIRFGKLVDGTGAVLTNAVVVIEGDRIKAVSASRSSIPANIEIIDLSRYTGIPGLIDMHTHLAEHSEEPLGPNNGPARADQRLVRPAALDVLLAQGAGRGMLEQGITSVRNLAAYQFIDIAMRDLINQGVMVGPRMFVSGPGLQTSSSFPLAELVVTADGPAEVTRVVRQLIAAGVDHIKIFGSTRAGPPPPGMGSQIAVWSGSYPAFTYEELKTAVDVAHSLGKNVAVHSYGPDGARDAVRAGADSIEHGLDMDDATMAEMARRGTFYVPTIYNNVYAAEHARLEDKELVRDYITRTLETAKRAVRAGVRFAMGSDGWETGMLGENTRELGWFVKAGMTPEQALVTATTNAAALLAKEKELGMIAPGYFADLVAVEGDPLNDINVVINNVRWVMKGGVVVFDKTQLGKLH